MIKRNISKLTKTTMRQAVIANFDVRINTFLFSKNKDNYNAQSKYEGINATVNKDDPNWEKTMIRHIKWQLGI